MNINSERLFGLIGYPLVHSFSKAYFTEKFESQNILGCSYRNFSITSIDDLKKVIEDNPALEGLNVTIPYKEKVLPFLHEIDPVAKEIGAVNCISIRNGILKGYNTDAFGFTMSIKPFLENHYERALILGTGGASRAIAHALSQWSIPFHFVSRNPSGPAHVSYKTLTEESMKHFPLIINTTPVGTYPDIDDCPDIPYEGLSASHFLYDLIYNPEETTFLRLGKRVGCKTMNGLSMLRFQAERSWEIWNAPL